MKRKTIVLFFAAGLIAVPAAVLRAEGEKAEKSEKAAKQSQPSPAKALQTALQNLRKADSYLAKVSIEGGLSSTEDHKINERTVSEDYEGEVFGSVMKVQSPKAFRLPKKGVAYIDGYWRNILSDPKTVLLERLFTFPEIIMTRALTHAAKGGRWLTLEEEKALGFERDDEESDASGDESDGKKDEPSGKTVTQKPKAEKSGPAPQVVSVEVPPKEALQHFTEVQNSGCMSGG
jgi:hypothetical protein